MEKKTDRRVRKTKNQLRTGLARLMKKKNIGQITVKELVDDVDINRSTFYLHYSDIPSLLKEIEDDMIEEIERAILEHPIKIEKDTTYLFIEDLFRVLSDNRGSDARFLVHTVILRLSGELKNFWKKTVVIFWRNAFPKSLRK